MTPIVSSRPLEIITADITGPLPRSSLQNKYALVVVDHFTKWVEIFPLRTQEATEVAKRLMKVVCRFGIPDQILTDQGTNFQAELLEEIWNLLDVHKTRTTPYHPQCDGQSERFMRTIKEMITSYVSENQRDWDAKLEILTFAYNTATHEGTKHSPYYLMFGRKPKVPLDLISPTIRIAEVGTFEKYVQELEANFKSAYEKVNRSQRHKMDLAKIRHDRNVYAAKFERGDLVWLAVKDNKTGKTKKLRRKWKGPYEILNESKEGPYQIRLTTSKNGAKQTVNRDLLKRCFMRDPDRFQMKEPMNRPTETNDEEIQKLLEIDFFERGPANEISPQITVPSSEEPSNAEPTRELTQMITALSEDTNTNNTPNPNSNQQPQSKPQIQHSTVPAPTNPQPQQQIKRKRGRPRKVPEAATEQTETEELVSEAEERPKRISKR